MLGEGNVMDYDEELYEKIKELVDFFREKTVNDGPVSYKDVKDEIRKLNIDEDTEATIFENLDIMGIEILLEEEDYPDDFETTEDAENDFESEFETEYEKERYESKDSEDDDPGYDDSDYYGKLVIEDEIFDSETESKKEESDKEQPDKKGDLDLIKVYFGDIGRFQLLTAEEEIELAKRIENGDKNAREIFINSNLKLVVSIAKHYLINGQLSTDIIQDGYFGLEKAVEKFDWKKGNRFSTYATWWIRQAIRRSASKQGNIIKIPENAEADRRDLTRTMDSLAQKYKREPTVTEISVEMEISEDEVYRILGIQKQPTSLDTPINDENDATSIGNFVKDEDAVDVDNVISLLFIDERLKEIIDERLSEQEIDVLEMIFVKGMNEKDVSTELGLPLAKFKRLKSNALRKLELTPEIEHLKKGL